MPPPQLSGFRRPSFATEVEGNSCCGTLTLSVAQDKLNELTQHLQLQRLRAGSGAVTTTSTTATAGSEAPASPRQPPTPSARDDSAQRSRRGHSADEPLARQSPAAADSEASHTPPAAKVSSGTGDAMVEMAIAQTLAVKARLLRIQSAIDYRERHPYEPPTSPPQAALIMPSYGDLWGLPAPPADAAAGGADAEGSSSSPPGSMSRRRSSPAARGGPSDESALGSTQTPALSSASHLDAAATRAAFGPLPALSPFERVCLGNLLGGLVLDIASLSISVQEQVFAAAAEPPSPHRRRETMRPSSRRTASAVKPATDPRDEAGDGARTGDRASGPVAAAAAATGHAVRVHAGEDARGPPGVRSTTTAVESALVTPLPLYRDDHSAPLNALQRSLPVSWSLPSTFGTTSRSSNGAGSFAQPAVSSRADPTQRARAALQLDAAQSAAAQSMVLSDLPSTVSSGAHEGHGHTAAAGLREETSRMLLQHPYLRDYLLEGVDGPFLESQTDPARQHGGPAGDVTSDAASLRSPFSQYAPSSPPLDDRSDTGSLYSLEHRSDGGGLGVLHSASRDEQGQLRSHQSLSPVLHGASRRPAGLDGSGAVPPPPFSVHGMTGSGSTDGPLDEDSAGAELSSGGGPAAIAASSSFHHPSQHRIRRVSSSGSSPSERSCNPSAAAFSRSMSLVRRPRRLDIPAGSSHTQNLMSVSDYYQPRSYSLRRGSMSSSSYQPSFSNRGIDSPRSSMSGLGIKRVISMDSETQDDDGPGALPARLSGHPASEDHPADVAALRDSSSAPAAQAEGCLLKATSALENSHSYSRSARAHARRESANNSAFSNSDIRRVSFSDLGTEMRAGSHGKNLSSSSIGAGAVAAAPVREAPCANAQASAPIGESQAPAASTTAPSACECESTVPPLTGVGGVDNGDGSSAADPTHGDAVVPGASEATASPPPVPFYVMDVPCVAEFVQLLHDIEANIDDFSDADLDEMGLRFAIPGIGILENARGQSPVLPAQPHPAGEVDSAAKDAAGAAAREPGRHGQCTVDGVVEGMRSNTDREKMSPDGSDALSMPGCLRSRTKSPEREAGHGGHHEQVTPSATAGGTSSTGLPCRHAVSVPGDADAAHVFCPLLPGGERARVVRSNFHTFRALVLRRLQEVQTVDGLPLPFDRVTGADTTVAAATTAHST